jgi:hypothetical protein
MSPDPQARPPLPSAANPLANAPGILRLAAMIMSAGALLLPLTWLIVRIDAHGMLAWMAPVFAGWLLAAPPVSLTFLRAAGKPWFDGGKVWMASCALLHVVALLLFALANSPTASRAEAPMLYVFTGLGILAIGIPLALVGWIRYAVRASRSRRPDALRH